MILIISNYKLILRKNEKENISTYESKNAKNISFYNTTAKKTISKTHGKNSKISCKDAPERNENNYIVSNSSRNEKSTLFVSILSRIMELLDEKEKIIKNSYEFETEVSMSVSNSSNSANKMVPEYKNGDTVFGIMEKIQKI